MGAEAERPLEIGVEAAFRVAPQLLNPEQEDYALHSTRCPNSFLMEGECTEIMVFLHRVPVCQSECLLNGLQTFQCGDLSLDLLVDQVCILQCEYQE